VIKQVKTRLQ